MNNKQQLFLKEKPVGILVAIRKTPDEIYTSIACKKVDTTYAHACKIKDELKHMGLLTAEKKGRKRVLELTEPGKVVADQLIEINEMLETGEPGALDAGIPT